jgi:hypothetical protein
MERVGDELAGFSFGDDEGRGIFQVTGWGFWNAELAIAFGAKIPVAVRQRVGSKRLVFDMSNLKPMRDEGQEACAKVFRSLAGLGVTSMTVVTVSHLMRLQLMRLVTESGAVNVQWLSGSAEPVRNG